MAGEDDDKNLVSEVIIDGVDAALKDLDKLGQKGAEAFKQAGDAAEKAAPKVEKFGDAAADAAKKSEDLVSPRTAVKMAGLQSATQELARSLKKNVKEVVEFGVRVAALGTAGAAAVGGIIALASSISKQLAPSTDILEKNTKAQIDGLKAQQSAEASAINYRSSLRKLFNEFSGGGMEYSEYSKRLQQLKTDHQEQIRVQAELAESQEYLERETARLNKQLEESKTYYALVEKYGAPLVASFKTLGDQANQLRKSLTEALSPAFAAVVDTITDAITKNASSIEKFASDVSKYIVTFVRDNKQAIGDALQGIGEIAGFLIRGFVEAAPAILKVINEAIIPAVRSFIAFLNGVAAKINETFGTNISGGFILIAIGVLKFTKAIQVVIGLLSTLRSAVGVFSAINTAITLAAGQGRTFLQVLLLLVRFMGPWGVAITAISVALGILFAKVDWAAWGKAATDSLQAIQNGAARLVQAITIGWNGLVEFFANLPTTIGASVDALWAHIKETAAALVTDVSTILNGIIDWFANLPKAIGDIFVSVSNAIQQAFQSAFDYVQGLVQPWVDGMKNALQPIIDLINTIKDFIGSGSGSSQSSPPGLARGGHVGAGSVSGPGTSTSDSILAWLSNNEFVMRAKAVAKYGLGFMRAVNAGTLDLSRIGRFAAGGLVQGLSLPQLSLSGADLGGASGGSSAAMRPLSLHINGETYDGLLAPATVADRLVTYSVQKKTRSAGRKPSWLG